MALQFEQFDLTPDHPWAPTVVSWVVTELKEKNFLDGTLEDAVSELCDEACAYYGLVDVVDGRKELLAVGALHGPHEDDAIEMSLERLVVRHDRQRQGLGSLTLSHLEGEARKKGVRSLWLYPEDEGRVRKFYEDRGYKQVAHPYDKDEKIHMKVLG